MIRILIVEDSSSAQQKLLSILKPFGQCYLAGNGQEAVDLVQYYHNQLNYFDLIIMDIIMPIKDGLTAVKEIREYESRQLDTQSRELTIIIVSTVQDAEHILFAQYDCGADGYITKPFDRQTVLHTLHDLGLETRKKMENFTGFCSF